MQGNLQVTDEAHFLGTAGLAFTNQFTNPLTHFTLLVYLTWFLVGQNHVHFLSQLLQGFENATFAN